MKPITSWHQLAGLMSNRTVSAYQRLYDSPEDLELFSAGIAEVPVAGGLLGPTFTCIIGRQYHNIRCHTTHRQNQYGHSSPIVRKGDRFWYENGGWPSSFTLEQLQVQCSVGEDRRDW